jgi:hypothetical protein
LLIGYRRYTPRTSTPKNSEYLIVAAPSNRGPDSSRPGIHLQGTFPTAGVRAAGRGRLVALSCSWKNQTQWQRRRIW